MSNFDSLKRLLTADLEDRMRQGYAVEPIMKKLEMETDSFDAMLSLAREGEKAPLRADWPWVEPDTWEEIEACCDPARDKGTMAQLDDQEVEERVRCAFTASVCGCVLGKPLEEPPYGTLNDIREAAQAVGQWPLLDYVSDEMLTAWGRRNPSWVETTRGRIRFVAPDDDITYSIMGMMLLEKSGTHFTHDEMRQMWIEHLPIYTCWGPERMMLLRAGFASLTPDMPENPSAWADGINPGRELCGALIRADAYGYACPAWPELAAHLAWKDASFTHRKTGVYSAMFIAAAIAIAFVAKDWKEIVEGALRYIPQQSRFYAQAAECLRLVDSSASFEEGYAAVHERFGMYTAGQIVQEIGTIINTLKYARNPEQGIAMQVAQGNDTDSFACSCGSILGAFFGTRLPAHWTEPFQDKLCTTMGCFNETSLSAVTERMAQLHRRVRGESI